MRSLVMAAACAAFVVCAVQPAPAQPPKKPVPPALKQRSQVNQPWEHKADRNRDGHVGPVEARAWHRRTVDVNGDGTITVVDRRAVLVSWRNAVNTSLEKKYDANADGFLEPAEARELLLDRITVIKTDGKAIVTTDLEREFDDNGDGVIDPDEAKAIQEALD